MDLDLNAVGICTDSGIPVEFQSARGILEGRPAPFSGLVEIVVRNLELAATEFILQSDAIVGCVAWLTNRQILEAASTLGLCQFVVQKEDFLRPDKWSKNGRWRQTLRSMYDALRCPITRYELPSPFDNLSTCADPGIDPVRCCGLKSNGKDLVSPKMHHKFMVRCEIKRWETEYGPHEELLPKAVWTGSFNFTENGSNSLENAVILYDMNAAHVYFTEWLQVLAISEPLDWTQEWIAPEWRIGT